MAWRAIASSISKSSNIDGARYAGHARRWGCNAPPPRQWRVSVSAVSLSIFFLFRYALLHQEKPWCGLPSVGAEHCPCPSSSALSSSWADWGLDSVEAVARSVLAVAASSSSKLSSYFTLLHVTLPW